MYTWLTRDKGYKVSKNRIHLLYYKVMGLRSLMPGKHTSRRNKEHKVYPYLLRNVKIERVNQVWATDITYIPMAKGFMYLTADWVTAVVKVAIECHGEPEIINIDQGSQYTSDAFTGMVLHEDRNIKLSMDGKGRATDNAFIESLWKTVKYEKIYLNPPEDGLELYQMLDDYFHYYNEQRWHTKIEDEIPAEVYRQAA